MAFELGLPRGWYAEFYLNSEWVDLIEHIRQTPGIKIERWRKNEQAKPTPSGASFWLDDSVEGGNGDYTPRNPLGTYYPYFGRNVPVQIGIGLTEDDFNRTVNPTWGVSADGLVWSNFGTGSSTSSVSAGLGLHSLPNTNSYQVSAEFEIDQARNVEIGIDCTIASIANVLDGNLEPANLVLSGQGLTTYYLCRITVNPVEDVSVEIKKIVDNNEVTISTTVDLETAYSGQQWSTKAQRDGNTIRFKVWPTATAEPLNWTVQAVDDGSSLGDPLPGGWSGVRSGVGGGNTNTKPIVFQYSNWYTRVPRFSGETSEVVPERDLSQNNRVTKVECGTIFRRMEQGTAPVQSTLRRFVASGSVAGLINYWPIEEERFANQIASAFPGKDPMIVGGSDLTLVGGLGGGASTVEFAADDSIACSAPLPHTNLSTWRNTLLSHTTTGRYDLRFLLKFPAQTDPPVWVTELYTNGTVNRWHVQLESDNSISVRAFAGLDGIVLDDFGNAVVSDTPALWYLQIAQNGSNIDYNLSYVIPGTAINVSYTSGTINSRTVGRALAYGQISGFDGGFEPSDLVYGHMMIGTSQVSSSNFHSVLSAWTGESAVRRMTRLADENGLPIIGGSYSDDSADGSALMGPQQVDTLLNLLVECADTDHGLFGDARGDNTFMYLPLKDLYRKTPSCTLDNSLNHLAEEFQPIDDDAFTVNDVTTKARRGSSARLEKTTGAMNSGDPGSSVGAVGRYDVSKQINPGTNEQLRQSANWLLHLGTTDESRFPGIAVNLHDQTMLDDLDLTMSIIDLDVGDVIALTNLESWYIFDDVSQLIYGYTEVSNTEYIHTIEFNTGPYSPYHVDNFGAVRMDSSDSSLNSGIDDNDTVFDVTTPGLTRWVTESDQINTARVLTFAGTTTTAPVSEDFAKEINIGDKLQLYTQDGILKEATVFTVTDLTTSSGTTTITFTPAAAASVALFNIVRTYLAANFPFDIIIGGERMTVTDINLTSDPQQFVVTRAVNGVAKSHLTGAQVKLFNPYYLGK